MNRIHAPVIDARYWLAILLASVFGTNMGDFYAHESGLGLVPGLAVLVLLAAATFLVERRDGRVGEAYYWLVIVIIRTGATNIADYLAFRARIPAIPLAIGLALLIAVAAWRMRARASPASTDRSQLPNTDWVYWGAMLAAGVFGTVLGDVCSKLVGQGGASVGLGLLYALALSARRVGSLPGLFGYWTAVAVARTAGTAMGDWLAESGTLPISLSLSTLLTGALFVAVVSLWRGSRSRLTSPQSP